MKTTTFTIALLALAACGDNTDNTPPDGSITGDGGGSADAEPELPTRAVLTATAFANPVGNVSVLDVEKLTAEIDVGPASAVSGDTLFRHIGNELFIINRSANNITILKDSDYSLVEQLSTGAGSNPYDVAVINNKLYVATYNTTGIVELTRGSSTITEIDLSVDEPDDAPNCASIAAIEGKLYVSCQLLDGINAVVNGKVYVVDPTTRAITTTLTLSTQNPTGLFEHVTTGPHAGELLVPTINYVSGDGCIERVVTGATPSAEGCLATNTQLGGGAARLAVNAGGTKLLAVVSRPDYSGADIRTIDLATDTVATGTVNAAPDEKIGDVVYCPDGTIVATEAPPMQGVYGLRVYGPNGTQRTTAPIDVGLKPQSPQGLVCY